MGQTLPSAQNRDMISPRRQSGFPGKVLIMAGVVRKISAKALVADIQAGLDSRVVLQKYRLSMQQFDNAVKKLIEVGAISESELGNGIKRSFGSHSLINEPTSVTELNQGSPVSLKQEKSCSHQKEGRLHGEASPRPINPSEWTEVEGAKSSYPKQIFDTKRLRAIASELEGVLQTLSNTDQPLISYVWRAWLIIAVPSTIIGIVGDYASAAFVHEAPHSDIPFTFLVIGGVLVFPWIETVLMGWILTILRSIVGQRWDCLVSAAIWGLLHASFSVVQGVSAAWGFFIYSRSFLEWDKKSRNKAICVTALIHMCHNGVVIAVMLSVKLILDNF
jgi:hypothetical protein